MVTSIAMLCRLLVFAAFISPAVADKDCPPPYTASDYWSDVTGSRHIIREKMKKRRPEREAFLERLRYERRFEKAP
jgi:hypothetical protein